MSSQKHHSGAIEASPPWERPSLPRFPRISLVVPNFNSGPTLTRALETIVSQQYPDLQLILADAGSTDESAQAIDRYRDHFDVLIAEADDGQAHGINRAFTHADGDIHGWLCSDDELMPGALDHVAEMFRTHPHADLISGGCQRIFPDKAEYVVVSRPDTWDVIGVINVVEQPSTFWRGALHRHVGELETSYHLGFDWDFWARMRDANANFVTTEQVLSRYHFSDTNKSGNAGNLFAEEAYRHIRQHGPHGGRLADAFRFIYRHFDIKGSLDKPPSGSKLRFLAYLASRAMLTLRFGRSMNLYNWHFASQQERGQVWWR